MRELLAGGRGRMAQRWKTRRKFSPHVFLAACALALAYAGARGIVGGGAVEDRDTVATRHLLGVAHCPENEVFPYHYQNHWLVTVMEMLGVLYMFLGLAVVCDEYFVLSLDAICEQLDLSDDVAGATFMAAGSSAPELFTSTAASFTAGNPTGVGTIIGSAIFNITVISGVTAFFAGQALQLDWRPLTRDSTAYTVTILALFFAFFFGTGLIPWYVSLIFLILYILYVAFMKINSRVMSNCTGPMDEQAAELGLVTEARPDGHQQHTNNPLHSAAVRMATEAHAFGRLNATHPHFEQYAKELPKDPHGWSKGDVITWLHQSGCGEHVKVFTKVDGAILCRMQKEDFKAVLSGERTVDGIILWNDLSDRLEVLRERLRAQDAAARRRDAESAKEQEAARGERKKRRVRVRKAPAPPTDDDGFAMAPERTVGIYDGDTLDDTMVTVDEDVSHSTDDFYADGSDMRFSDETLDAEHAIGNALAALPPKERFKEVVRRVQMQLRVVDIWNEPISQLDPDQIPSPEDQDEAPEGAMEKILFYVCYPYTTAFKYTIPDCRKERWAKLYLVTFLMSIMWIGLLSLFMVGWSNNIGCFVGVPRVVMGLTVLAAGTSIPDAMGSVLVAREGQGDMAIANALGSNIFDILIGLGLPWLFSSLIRGGAVPIDDTGIAVYVGILLANLTFFFLSIAARGWICDKKTACLLALQYVAFIIFSLLSAFPCQDGAYINLSKTPKKC